MDLFYGILVLAAFIGIAILWRKFDRYTSKKLNQNVFMRGAHREGQQLVQQRLTFTTQAPAGQVMAAVLSTVEVESKVPKLVGKVYLVEVTSSRLVYAFGSRLQTYFRGVFSMSTSTKGTQGSWEIINWLEQDGLVTGQEAMMQLVADINTALRSVDPNARLR